MSSVVDKLWRILSQPREDGFVNGTEMCRSCGRRFNDYLFQEASKELLDLLSCRVGGTPFVATPGRYGGSWIHQLLAFDLACWLEPTFKLSLYATYSRQDPVTS